MAQQSVLRNSLALWVAVAVVGGAVPWIVDSGTLSILILSLLFVYFCVSWNIVGGFAGQFSLAHSLFIAAGAYTSTLLAQHTGLSPWLGMFAGAALAAIMGVAIAWISFRYALPPLSFALVTLALAMMGYLAIGATEFFGGNGGLAITGRGSPWTYQFRGDWPYYYVILVYCLLAVGLSGWIYHSKPGLYFRALRDNDRASRAIGIDVLRYKMLAMGVSAFLSALGGTFYAQYLLYVDPRTFAGLNIVIEIILFTVVGGTGTILGPVVGPLLAVPLGEWLRNSLGDAVPGLHLLLFGMLLVLVIRFMPAGIVGSLARFRPAKSK